MLVCQPYINIKHINKFNKISSYLVFESVSHFFSSMSPFLASHCPYLNRPLDFIEVCKIIENLANIHKIKHEHGHWTCPNSIFNKCSSNFYVNTFQGKYEHINLQPLLMWDIIQTFSYSFSQLFKQLYVLNKSE